MTAGRSRGLLVSVEGIDGSGKSELAASLAARLAEEHRDALLLDRHTATAGLSGYLADHLAGLRRLIWEYPPGAVTSDLGFHHWTGLIGAWFHGLDHLVVRPALDAGRPVVADSWFYKFTARFALTAGHSDAGEPFVGVSVPDLVIWLDVPPETCADRRPDARATERGEWQGLADEPDAFTTYQHRVRGAYRRLAAAHQWCRLGPMDLPELTERARELVESRSEPIGAGRRPGPVRSRGEENDGDDRA
ncbi:hypothetical protein E1264_01760 [Actinomadura sp. KC216]|uniref:dTMP kinase n=1 Tax=Actinomadura sp. KC216 TaxID=2530370 RepID=UPI00105048C3|nr:AAA family ATPase [Actinomadura sp. KC216]TDB91381.1 hypothetical protein E1264_01760 [Actinomadura sp. KC216]